MASEFEVTMEDLDEQIGNKEVNPFVQEDDDGPPMPVLKPTSRCPSLSTLDLEGLNEWMQRKLPVLVRISKMGDEVEMEQITSQEKPTGEGDNACENLSPPELHRFDELDGKLDDWTECSPPILLPCYLEGLEAEPAMP